MLHEAYARSKTSRQIRFAQFSAQDNVLSVQTLKDPYLYDLRLLTLQQWLPMMVVVCGLFYAVSGFQQVLPSVLVGLFVTIMNGTIFMRILWNMRAASTYTFDRSRVEVHVKGYKNVTLPQVTVVLQTRWGWSGNRQFRLLAGSRGGMELVMTQTPALEDGAHAQQYYGETYSRRWMSEAQPWVDYQGQQDAIDIERDAGIFLLFDEIYEFFAGGPANNLV